MNDEKFCEKISNIAIKAILYEVSATPKPGLVDRANSGAHNDMDFFTFLSSASVLSSYFYRCTDIGINFKGQDYRDLLLEIRPIGKKAENDMFKATNGINTHKGIIFSEGIISAAVGSLYSEGKSLNIKEISNRIKEISKGITSELEDVTDKKDKTYGEKLFIKYGVKGIREEVENGFITVLESAYHIFRDLVKEGKHNINDIMVETLLHLMEATEDSNILGRHDMETLKFAQASASKALGKGGIFTDEGRMFLKYLDRVFIEKNISPGGSADLLAVTLMFYMIENGDII